MGRGGPSALLAGSWERKRGEEEGDLEDTAISSDRQNGGNTEKRVREADEMNAREARLASNFREIRRRRIKLIPVAQFIVYLLTEG